MTTLFETAPQFQEQKIPPAVRNKIRVLLVDDAEDFLVALSRALRLTERYEPCMETHGLNALERVREFHPDVVLLDVMMPEIDGGEVAAMLRATADTRNVPIVFITALVTAKEGEELPLRRGGEWFLPKPITMEVLERTIEQAVSHPTAIDPPPPDN